MGRLNYNMSTDNSNYNDNESFNINSNAYSKADIEYNQLGGQGQIY